MSIEQFGRALTEMSSSAVNAVAARAIDALGLGESEAKAARAELQAIMADKLCRAGARLGCVARIDSVKLGALVSNAEHMSVLQFVLHLASEAGAESARPTVRNIEDALEETCRKIADAADAEPDCIDCGAVRWQRDRFVAEVTWALVAREAQALAALHDKKATEALARVREDAKSNATRYSLERELARVEQHADDARLASAVALHTRSHNGGGGGGDTRSGRGLARYKKPAGRAAGGGLPRGRAKRRESDGGVSAIRRVKVPHLGRAANIEPLLKSGARMRIARSMRAQGIGASVGRLFAGLRSIGVSAGIVAPLSREQLAERERTLDYVASHAADDDMFTVY